MTEEFVRIVWLCWLDDWLVSGSQQRRQELLARKACLESALGCQWSAPYRYDNPPRSRGFTL